MAHPQSTQRCRKCQRDLPREAFDPCLDKRGRAHGLQLRCRECQQLPRTHKPYMVSPSLRCRACKRDLPRDAFERRIGTDGAAKGWHASCRTCRALRHRSLAEHLWSQVDKTDTCWAFTGPIDANGYGRFRWEGQKLYAHRVAYEITYGPLLPGLFACHRCDNPPCVRPDHLFAGTSAENTRDMMEKGRHHDLPGEHHPLSKLTDADIVAIRQLHARGQSTGRSLARRFGVTPTTISRIVRRKAWRHVA